MRVSYRKNVVEQICGESLEQWRSLDTSELTIRCGRGKLIDFRRPKVMGIINATPDSFYCASRVEGEESFRQRCREMLSEGADIIDVGGYSSRPGCEEVSEEEEWRRLSHALAGIRKALSEQASRPASDVATMSSGGMPVLISVDTFRAGIARKCVEEFGVDIINDIGGGTLDGKMFSTIAELGVGYVLMHFRGTPQTMMGHSDYDDVTADVIREMAFRLAELRQLGVADVIVDPGFGFSKSVEDNFRLLGELPEFRRLGCPLLAGLSRKSMIWRTLGITPEESLNGTTALNMAALMGGADILRVHDVKAAVETVDLFMAIKNSIGE